jgi:hypothetical protein
MTYKSELATTKKTCESIGMNTKGKLANYFIGTRARPLTATTALLLYYIVRGLTNSWFSPSADWRD